MGLSGSGLQHSVRLCGAKARVEAFFKYPKAAYGLLQGIIHGQQIVSFLKEALGKWPTQLTAPQSPRSIYTRTYSFVHNVDPRH